MGKIMQSYCVEITFASDATIQQEVRALGFTDAINIVVDKVSTHVFETIIMVKVWPLA
jgi:hypothetical protein